MRNDNPFMPWNDRMNQDNAKRYLAKYDTWKKAMSIVSKYDSQR